MIYVIILILIIFSALFSGLTFGLLGLDKAELERKIKVGNRLAKKIYTVRKDGNLLLVTLLLGNVLVNSILSVTLGAEFDSMVAVLVSTSLIVVCGEIMPQAIFYRHAFVVGSYFVPVVRIFLVIFFPIAKPIAMFLDKILGEEKMEIITKQEMAEMVKSHEDADESDIDNDDEDIILGALAFSEKEVQDIMTPRNVVFLLEENDILDEKKLVEIKRSGFTRIPVFRGCSVCFHCMVTKYVGENYLRMQWRNLLILHLRQPVASRWSWNGIKMMFVFILI